jgi:hypothetical protein
VRTLRVSVVAALLAAACISPTSTTDVFEGLTPSGRFVVLPLDRSGLPPASAEMLAEADSSWDAVTACVGVRPELSRFPVWMARDAFYCGEAQSWGCYYGDRLTVLYVQYLLGLRHEFIHLALHASGQDPSHANPAFQRCDR